MQLIYRFIYCIPKLHTTHIIIDNTIIIDFIETRLQDIQLAQQQKYRWLG